MAIDTKKVDNVLSGGSVMKRSKYSLELPHGNRHKKTRQSSK